MAVDGVELPGMTKGSDDSRGAILSAAAECFMASGFAATSIDDVAQALGATKGMVYHYYRSKADLFFDVHRAGMAINLRAIEPVAAGSEDPRSRLEAMCRVHLGNIVDHMSYQRVLMQGVEMHLSGPTTPGQRMELARLMRERERYEELFRQVLVEGESAGYFDFDNASFASKAILAVLNNPVLWYRRRQGRPEADREAVVDAFTAHALACVGADHQEEPANHEQ